MPYEIAAREPAIADSRPYTPCHIFAPMPDHLERLEFRLTASRGAVIAAAIAITVVSCGRSNATLELKLAHSASPKSLIALSAEEFARRANEQPDGRAKVTVYGHTLDSDVLGR